jgi:serine/threonine-protein kinase
MLTRGGRCKVVDFGLARVETASGKFVPLGESVGTPQFLAPEVIQGQAATARSDIYSLGATLWFLLAGRAPFVADSKVKTLQMQVSAALPDIRQVRADLPEGLVLALARAMAKRPEDRFESAGQFAKALRVHTIPVGGASGSGLTTFAQQSGVLAPLERQASTQRINPRQTAILVGSAGALVVVLVGGFLYWNRMPPGGANTAQNTADARSVERSRDRADDTATVRNTVAQAPTPSAPAAPALNPAAADQAPTPSSIFSPPVAVPVARALPPNAAPPPATPPQPAAPSKLLPRVLDVTHCETS